MKNTIMRALSRIGESHKDDKELTNVYIPLATMLIKMFDEPLEYYTPEQLKAKKEGKGYWYYH